jgi:hypothetical protein
MGRTEFLTPTIRSEPRLESATSHESEMALFNECMQSCAHIMLDIADIVRDADITPSLTMSTVSSIVVTHHRADSEKSAISL